MLTRVALLVGALVLLVAVPTSVAHVACSPDVRVLGEARSNCLAASGAGSSEGTIAIVGTGESDGAWAIAGNGFADGDHWGIALLGCARAAHEVDPTCGSSS